MAACVRECECAVRDNDALARRKSERGKKCTLKVNRLAIFLYLNSSIKVPMTTVWLAVLSARPRLEPTGAIGGIGAKASAPTSARAKMQAFLYMVTLPVWHSRWIVVLANQSERTMASEQCEQYAAMPSMCTFHALGWKRVPNILLLYGNYRRNCPQSHSRVPCFRVCRDFRKQKPSEVKQGLH